MIDNEKKLRVNTVTSYLASLQNWKVPHAGQIVMVIKILKVSAGFNDGSSDRIDRIKILIHCDLAGLPYANTELHGDSNRTRGSGVSQNARATAIDELT
jgi:hypothetical protein